MAPSKRHTEKQHCLVVEKGGGHRIARRSSLWIKVGKKWLLPSDFILSNSNEPLYLGTEGGQKTRIQKLLKMRNLEHLREQTTDAGRRVPVNKRRTFPPHHRSTKAESRINLLRLEEKRFLADRKALTRAQHLSETDADLAYSRFTSPSGVEAASVAPADSSMSDCHQQLSPGLASEMLGTPEQSDAETDVIHTRQMPGSLTYHSLGDAETRPSPYHGAAGSSTPISERVRRVSRIRPYLPSPKAHPKPTKKVLSEGSAEMSNIRKDVRNGFAAFQTSIAKITGNFAKAVVDLLAKIHADLVVLKTKMVTADDIANMGDERMIHRRADSRGNENNHVDEDESDELSPDENGNVELCPGVTCSYEDYTTALLAKSTRKRANVIMKLLWSDNINNLYVGGHAGRRSATESADREPLNRVKIPGTDYVKIKQICKSLQRTQPVDVVLKENRIEPNLRTWASHWLKNRRHQLKPREPSTE